MSDIIDDIDRLIDRLIDRQLETGEPLRGYDFGDPTYPRCPHCNRHWHGLPITEQIAAMYAIGRYNESYSAATDDSRVLCEGSDFIGPIRDLPDHVAASGIPGWLNDLIANTMQYAAEAWFTWPEPGMFWREQISLRWWRLGHTPDAFNVVTRVADPPLCLDVQVGNGIQIQAADYRWHNNRLDILTDSRAATLGGGTWEPLTAPGVTDHPEPHQ